VFGALVASLRPRQWTKNLLVFAGLIFSRGLHEPALVARSGLAFALFCLLSGGVYLINDVVDAERDRAHPQKRHRPVASGRLPRGGLVAGSASYRPRGRLLPVASGRGPAYRPAHRAGRIKHGHRGHPIIAAGSCCAPWPGDRLESSRPVAPPVHDPAIIQAPKQRHELSCKGWRDRHRRSVGAPAPGRMIAVVTASTLMAYASAWRGALLGTALPL
jgi:hypothetical protein